MAILAYLILTILWPVVTVVGSWLVYFLLRPFFDLLSPFFRHKGRVDFSLADVFQASTMGAIQFLVVFIGKEIFSWFDLVVNRWLIFPFAVWCAVLCFFLSFPYLCLLLSIPYPPHSRMEYHENFSMTVGLIGGLILATMWLF